MRLGAGVGHGGNGGQTRAGTGPVSWAGACWKRRRSFSTATVMVDPAGKVPARIALAIGVSSSQCGAFSSLGLSALQND